MTKQHFEAIASILREQMELVPSGSASGYDEGYYSGLASGTESIAESLASYFAETNPRFDRARFLNACGA